MNSTLITKESIASSCKTCGKQYTRKSSLERHQIMCEIVHKCHNKREDKIEQEENTELPSHTQLCKIVQELAYKCVKMEEEMNTMRKWIDKKKKKINIISWLNTNHINVCEDDFVSWYTNFIITNECLNVLFANNIYITLQTIFESILDNDAPIKCFSQKSNVFYIYALSNDNSDNSVDNNYMWRQMTNDDWILFMRTIQKKMIGAIIRWREDNVDRLKQNDKLSEVYNKGVIKITSIPTTITDTGISKVRGPLYNYLKTDLKTILEYEFEF